MNPLLLVVAVAAVLLFGGGGALSGLFGGGAGSPGGSNPAHYSNNGNQGGGTGAVAGTPAGNTSGHSASGAAYASNNGALNRNVAPEAREKFTKIKGNGQDSVTVMVYMCGTDLESRSGMGTADLSEMAKARLSSNVNLLVYTGGCSRWQNKIVSSGTNQIYRVRDGGLVCVNKDAGNGSMTSADTLSSYITWACANYPADRYGLILWDHGGGSLSGYGYDEKNKSSGSMVLSSIGRALGKAGQKFDFIGFDACLMATVETAQVLAPYADYMIASEETEPGIGWYYTDWLTDLSSNPSMATLDIGRGIADDFVDTCAMRCRGQSATLSVVDLAELSQTLPQGMAAFSGELLQKIKSNDYRQIASARNDAREFARSSVIDQIDMVDFAGKVGSAGSKELAEVLLSAVKYNRTSSDMSRAYGLSVYFPYKKMSSVNTAVATYKALDMNEDYTDCVRAFASLELGGQLSSGSSGSPLDVLSGSLFGGSSYLGSGYSGPSYSGGLGSADISDLLGLLMGASSGTSSGGTLGSLLGGSSNSLLGSLAGSVAGSAVGGSPAGSLGSLLGLDMGFFGGRGLDADKAAEYLSENQFDPTALRWTENADGEMVISLPEEQWDMVMEVGRTVFYRDGSGYAELGLDNTFDFDEEGNLLPDMEKTWISINDQPVAYFYLGSVESDDGSTSMTGKVPAMLNGQRVNLILVFDEGNPQGYVAGARTDYDSDETETVARGLTELKDGDVLEFLCDYYTEDGGYEGNYYLGEPLTVDGELKVSDTLLGDDAALVMYRFTDEYQQHYWTEVLEA